MNFEVDFKIDSEMGFEWDIVNFEEDFKIDFEGTATLEGFDVDFNLDFIVDIQAE